MMSKKITLEQMLNLSPYEFSNKFFVRKSSSKPAWNKGIAVPDSVRKKISDAQKGINRVSYDVRSKSQKGRIFSLKHRINISESRKGKVGLLGNNPRARAVICPAGIFDTIKEAAEAMGCDGGTIRSRILKGKDGYSWVKNKSKEMKITRHQ